MQGGISLGASGAIYGLVGLLTWTLPHVQSHIIFLPFFHTDLRTLLGGFMLLDIAGIVFGWRVFNHWAHLGGALFGLAYAPLISKRYWPNAQQELEAIRERYEGR